MWGKSDTPQTWGRIDAPPFPSPLLIKVEPQKNSGIKTQLYTYFHQNLIDLHEHLHTPKNL